MADIFPLEIPEEHFELLSQLLSDTKQVIEDRQTLARIRTLLREKFASITKDPIYSWLSEQLCISYRQEIHERINIIENPNVFKQIVHVLNHPTHYGAK